MTLTSLFDTPGCSIDTLDPVSNIKRLVTPSISTEIEGLSCSNDIGTVRSLTAFSRVVRWKELLFSTSPSRFPNPLFHFWFPVGSSVWCTRTSIGFPGALCFRRVRGVTSPFQSRWAVSRKVTDHSAIVATKRILSFHIPIVRGRTFVGIPCRRVALVARVTIGMRRAGLVP